jgi:uncharacterized protein (DUF1800 family)
MPDRATIAAFRFGYGLPQAGGEPSPEALLAQLTDPDAAAARFPAYHTRDVLEVMEALRAARVLAKEQPETKAGKKAVRRAVKLGKALAQRGAQAMMARAVEGAGLRERMVQFWADHFTVVGRNRAEPAWPTAMIEDVIRPHVGGRFGDMLAAVATHPAMLLYLDQAQSVGPNSARGARRDRGLNENYARELMELHTLGVGAVYSQDDVRQLAELLTGLAVDPVEGFVFDARRVEPGPERVLGRDYAGDGIEAIRAVLADLAARPETAAHLAHKLAVHFVADTPDPGLVTAMEAAFRDSGGDLVAVTAAMLADPAAWAEPAAKARQPFDFIVAALRALGVPGDAVVAMDEAQFRNLLLNPMTEMGQTWQGAPGPDGWPEEIGAWITPQGMAARIAWAMAVPARLRQPLPEAAAMAGAALGERLSGRLTWAIGAAENRREAVGLVLSSPEFNRR